MLATQMITLMEKYTLSTYIAQLQKMMEEHGDIAVGTSTGYLFTPPGRPVMEKSHPLDGDGLGDLSNEGKVNVCVIDRQPAAGHPYYRSMAHSGGEY